MYKIKSCRGCFQKSALALLCLCSSLSASDDLATRYQLAYLDLIELVDRTQQLSISSLDQSISLQYANDQINALTADDLLFISENSPDIYQLESVILKLHRQVYELETQFLAVNQSHTRTSQTRSEDGDIEIPPIDVFGECDATTPSLAIASLTTKAVLEEALSVARGGCLQTVVVGGTGGNNALLCEGLEIAAVAAATAFEAEEFCLSEKRAGTGEAIYDLSSNIATFLNSRFDDDISTRATQESVNAVQDSVDNANETLNDVETSLNDNFPVIENDLEATLSNLSQLETGLGGVVAQLQDLQFRAQIQQIDLSDVQFRTADLQQLADETRTDTLNILQNLAALATDQAQSSAAAQADLAEANRDRIAAVLGNQNASVIRYQLPAAQGGELEEVREVVIQSLASITQIGGQVGNATKAINMGDQAFNNGDFLTAYQRYAEAYLALISANSTLRAER